MEQNPVQPADPNLSPNDHGILSKRRLMIVIGIAVVVVILVVVGLVLFNLRGSNAPVSEKTPSVATSVTIDTQPYLYPCSVATRDDYARIWGFDDEKVGSVTEHSALAAKDIQGDGNLAKLAPSSTTKPRFTTSCSYWLARKNAVSVNNITVKLVQFASGEEAKGAFKSARSTASGDFTFDNVDNGTRQLSVLPSFTAGDSFIRLPELAEGLHTEKATFIAGSRMVELAYSLEDSETVEAITPLLDSYSQVIKANMDAKSLPTDLTGRETFVGKKLVDMCRRTDLSKLSNIFDSLEFRPDEVVSTNIYGSLEGSREAADGALSKCTLAFNNSNDRKAQDAIKKPKSSYSSTTLTSEKKWPHTILISVNTFASPSEAQAVFTAKKAQFNRSKDIKDVGDAAFKNHEVDQKTTIDESYIVKGSDLITIALRQLSNQEPYETAPATISDAQFKDAYQLVQSTITKNRE